ncbi:MAG: diaminopimelate epimerase [Bacteroidota bacterium]
MTFDLYKFHGAGNDFLLVNDPDKTFPDKDVEKIALLCHRHFGIGADGLMLLQPSSVAAFKMVYFNSDGKEGSMCGNGGRCIVAFAELMGVIYHKKIIRFEAIDGLHDAEILTSEKNISIVSLGLSSVRSAEKIDDGWFLNTGSPHFVTFVDNANEVDVVALGRKLRYDQRFAPAGANINFVEKRSGSLYVRTYERGVEDETLSCGTGVTASVIAAYFEKKCSNLCDVNTRGGNLVVSFQENNGVISDLKLQGPAEFVFKTTISFYI